MAHGAESTHTDERLTRLVEIERRLEARVQQAEVSALARVEAARDEVRATAGCGLTDVEATGRDEEAIELALHASTVERIAAEAASHAARLSAVPDAELERLALRAVSLVLDAGEAGDP